MANVEFLVELRGKRAAIGIDKLLQQGASDGEQDKHVRLRDLLVPYSPPEIEQNPDDVEKRLELLVDEVRNRLVDARMVARCAAASDQEQTFRVEVGSDTTTSAALGPGIDCSIRPVSLAPDAATHFVSINRQIATFKSLAFEFLTAFFALSITASEQSRSLTKEFVLKLPLLGAPEDRDARLLLAMLSNRERLLRYLFMLLTDAGLALHSKMSGGGAGWGDWDAPGPFGIPLLEPLLRALAEDPLRLDDVERLISDLGQSDQGRRLLPEELSTLWAAIRLVRASDVGAS